MLYTNMLMLWSPLATDCIYTYILFDSVGKWQVLSLCLRDCAIALLNHVGKNQSVFLLLEYCQPGILSLYASAEGAKANSRNVLACCWRKEAGTEVAEGQLDRSLGRGRSCCFAEEEMETQLRAPPS